MSAAALWVPLRSLHVPVLVSTQRGGEKESVGDGFVSSQDIFNLPEISRHPLMSPILFLSMSSGQTTKVSQAPQLGLVVNFRYKSANSANDDTYFWNKNVQRKIRGQNAFDEKCFYRSLTAY